MTITGFLLRSLIDAAILENPEYGELENTVEREILITPREPRHAKGVLNVWVEDLGFRKSRGHIKHLQNAYGSIPLLPPTCTRV